MARLPRFILPGQPQYVILRGNNHREIFCANEDYRFYLEKLQLACITHGCNLDTYVLMTISVNLLIRFSTNFVAATLRINSFRPRINAGHF